MSNVNRNTTTPAMVVELIKYRAGYIHHKRLLAARILLGRPIEFEERADQDLPAPTLADIEASADHWTDLVPDDPEVRVAVGRQLADDVGYTPDAAPMVAAALGETSGKPNGADAAGPSSIQPEDELEAAVLDSLRWRYLRRGETLIEAGESNDNLYVLVDGLLRAKAPTALGNSLEEIIDLNAGGVFGEATLLTGEASIYTVRAVRDCDICVMDKPAFGRLIHRHPTVMTRLATQMAATLRSGRPTQLDLPRATVTALLPATQDMGDFVDQLARELKTHGSTLVLSARDLDRRVQHELGIELEPFVDEYGFVDWLQAEARNHRQVLYIADKAYPRWTRRAVEQADKMLIVGQASEPGEISTVEQIVAAMPDQELLPPVDLVLLHASRAAAPGNTLAWLASRRVCHHHHVALDSGHGIARIGRFLRDRAIALVFGGGGMRSVACYGVARFLDEQGIRADIVGGTSGGAIVAALYAMGHHAETMLEITKTRLLKKKILMQPTLPLVGVMMAKRVVKSYKDVFGQINMEELWTTPYTISGNLTRAEMVVHETGPLWRAVRASTSIAGIFPPALNEEGELLIDGGIFNNTPADIARGMVHDGPVIAVDLGFTVRQRIPYAYGDYLSGWKVLRDRLNPFKEAEPTPSIVGIMMRANALGSINATAGQVAAADIALHPSVSDYGLFDFEAFDTIADAGYRTAQEQLAPWLDQGGLEHPQRIGQSQR